MILNPSTTEVGIESDSNDISVLLLNRMDFDEEIPSNVYDNYDDTEHESSHIHN